MIKAVIFDLDGTLVDTIGANAVAYCEAFRRYGINFTVEDYKDKHGKRWSQWGPQIANDKASDVHRCKQEIYDLMLEHVTLIDDVVSFYKESKNKYQCLLATNASKKCAQAVLEKFSLSFDKVFFGEDYRSDHDLLIDIQKCTGVKFFEHLLVDDGDSRLSAAKDLGMQTRKVTI